LDEDEMKLASLKNGMRDGSLVVVSKDLSKCVAVPAIAKTMQAALDAWDGIAPQLEDVSLRIKLWFGAGGQTLPSKIGGRAFAPSLSICRR
jgi:fumarylacetoacetate (FAA) hydrolase